MREQVIDIPSQSVITKDNIQVEIDGLLYIKVMDPKKAVMGLEITWQLVLILLKPQ